MIMGKVTAKGTYKLPRRKFKLLKSVRTTIRRKFLKRSKRTRIRLMKNLLEDTEVKYETSDPSYKDDSEEQSSDGYRDDSAEESRDGYRDDSAEESRDGYRDDSAEESRDGYRDDSAEESSDGYKDDSAEESSDGYRDDSADRKKKPKNKNNQLDLHSYPSIKEKLKEMKRFCTREEELNRPGQPLSPETWRKTKIHVLGELLLYHNLELACNHVKNSFSSL